MASISERESREIEAAFVAIVRERANAVFIAPDAFYTSRRSQFVTLAARDRIPTSHAFAMTLAELGLNTTWRRYRSSCHSLRSGGSRSSTDCSLDFLCDLSILSALCTWQEASTCSLFQATAARRSN